MVHLRFFCLALVALVLPSLAVATGFGGDSPPSRIPIPAHDFSATVEDHGGVVVEVDRVSYNGEVFLYGTLGAAQLTIPFEKLTKIEFKPSPKDDRREAVATTKDGQELSLLVDDDILCYGRTKVGNYSIEVKDLRRILFK